MNKKNFKIGKDIASRLDELARGLPVVSQMTRTGEVMTRKVQVIGQQLIDDGYKPSSGQLAIDPNIMYNVNRIVFVNHRQELEKAYQAEGEAGIIKYLDYVKTLKTASTVQMEKHLAGKKWYAKLWIKFTSSFKKPTVKIAK